jgi:predicted O-methyltransferase YrrM
MWNPKGITSPKVERYFYNLLPRRDTVLAEMERLATKHGIPIVGPAVGRLLYFLAQVSGARRIFEMGSAIGYSTIWLARAAGEGTEVHYSDGDPEKASKADEFFARAGVADRVHIHLGDSLDLLAKTPGDFDLIFIDVDKHDYPAAAKLAIPRVRRGGLLITDNTLWSARVARRAPKKDKQTRGIQELNRMLYASPELFTVLLPIRDGVTVCRKL